MEKPPGNAPGHPTPAQHPGKSRSRGICDSKDPFLNTFPHKTPSGTSPGCPPASQKNPKPTGTSRALEFCWDSMGHHWNSTPFQREFLGILSPPFQPHNFLLPPRGGGQGTKLPKARNPSWICRGWETRREWNQNPGIPQLPGSTSGQAQHSQPDAAAPKISQGIPEPLESGSASLFGFISPNWDKLG